MLLGGGISVASEAALWTLAQQWFTASPATRPTVGNQFTSLSTSDSGAADLLHGEADADWYVMYLNDTLRLASESKAPNVIKSFDTP
jgi:hypothetical protein